MIDKTYSEPIAQATSDRTVRFSLGVNFWPRRSASKMWQRFDPGEIGEDFARTTELGLDTVRFFLRWDDFAPDADRLDPVMLERLETIVSLADGAGLRTVPTLFCGYESCVGIGKMYCGPLLDAQLLLARAVGERLRAHAAVVRLGHRP